MTKIRARPSLVVRSSGVAMIAALALLAVASAVMLLMFLRTMDEIRHGRDDTAIVQTLLAAQGGTNLALSTVQSDVRDALDEIASRRSSTVNAWSFGNSNTDVPTAASVATDLAAVAAELQTVVDGFLCDDVDLGDGVAVTVRLFVTERACGDSLPPGTALSDGRFISGARREDGGNQQYAVPFVVVSEGQQGEFRRRVVTHGEAQFVVGRRSFSRYALFTDFHSYNGSRIWFADFTLFNGPVHTNGHFGFSGSPWFGGAVSSAGLTGSPRRPGAYGLGNGTAEFFEASELGRPRTDPTSPSMNVGSGNNRRQNRPDFAGIEPDWRAEYIPLPTNAFDQEGLARANGLYFEDRLARLELFAADASGAPVEDGEPSVYQYIRATTAGSGSTTTTYRLSPSGLLERRFVVGGVESWTTVTTTFNGLIYAEEIIDRLEGPGRTDGDEPASAGPAIASFAQLTLVAAGNSTSSGANPSGMAARITGDLTYENPPCEGSLRSTTVGGVRQILTPECDDLDARNVFGIFAPRGDVLIGNQNGTQNLNAPRNVRIQASLMASSGVVSVEDYDDGNDPRGNVQLLGGIIESEYGPFGQFDSRTQELSRGYGRAFTYDPRFARGLAPPYFPTVGIDGVTDVQTLTFGSREQVY